MNNLSQTDPCADGSLPVLTAGAEPSCPDDYVIVSTKWTRSPDLYVVFWRPNRAGYAWPLSWAGRYSEDEARDICDGYDEFAVRYADALKHSREPKPGYIDGDAGPVVTRRKLKTLRSLALTIGASTSQPPAPQEDRPGRVMNPEPLNPPPESSAGQPSEGADDE